MTGPRLYVLTATLLLAAATATAQDADLCGCTRAADLGAFDAGDPRTYPAGTTGCTAACDAGAIVLPLPPDGVLRFRSFTARGAFTITFRANAANTPATLLVAGDVTLRAPACCGTLSVSATSATAGSTGGPGEGGNAGVGGFRGGKGHGQPYQVFTPGESGMGPGGGVGSTTTFEAIGGTFVGTADLQTMAGGSGGGGGSGFKPDPPCTGGGGGGGGGALLIRANGSITLENVTVTADGGNGAEPGDRACGHGGGGGSGGAIRLVARSLNAAGEARLSARGGHGSFDATAGTAGRIRLESVDDSAERAFATQPLASRGRIRE